MKITNPTQNSTTIQTTNSSKTLKSPKVSTFFLTEKENSIINERKELLHQTIQLIQSNPEYIRLSGGLVFKWFRIHLWRPILIDKVLKPSDKHNIMMLCVLEKVKYRNMSDKTYKRFIKETIFTTKKSIQKSISNPSSPPPDSDQPVAAEGEPLRVAAA